MEGTQKRVFRSKVVHEGVGRVSGRNGSVVGFGNREGSRMFHKILKPGYSGWLDGGGRVVGTWVFVHQINR